jgi:diguanylate cyclase (GGDEF)-like protein
MMELEAAMAGKGIVDEQELARQEEAVGKVAWFGGLAVAAVTVACFLLLVLTSDGAWWEYTLYALVGGVPLAYALFCTFVMRQMDLSVFNRYRQQLVGQLTDLQELVFRDELTGLFNRRHFYDKMRLEVEKSRVSRQPLAVMLLDLDGLKVINDEHGHGVGDIVLANLGRMIAGHTRSCDVPCRLGGDEFGIVMPGTDKRGAFALARRLWAGLEASPMYEDEGKAMNVTVSIGLAGYPWGGESIEEMIQWADADMYANKVSRKLAREMPPMEAQGSGDLESVPEDVFGSV